MAVESNFHLPRSKQARSETLSPRRRHTFFLLLLFVSYHPSHAEPKDEVHLQWALCDHDPQTVLPKFGLQVNHVPRKQDMTTYYDTRPPIHTQQGLGLRTKTSKGQKISSVKGRFLAETLDIPNSVDCLWDRYGNNTFYTCEKRSLLDAKNTWSTEQIRFADQYQNVE
ncbi:hypothetical protein Vi05172_g4950 [Venturia inaequalis]|nr:hypothetical protein Vi05172_g4950 [Venturia inaequalis]